MGTGSIKYTDIFKGNPRDGLPQVLWTRGKEHNVRRFRGLRRFWTFRGFLPKVLTYIHYGTPATTKVRTYAAQSTRDNAPNNAASIRPDCSDDGHLARPTAVPNTD